MLRDQRNEVACLMRRTGQREVTAMRLKKCNLTGRFLILSSFVLALMTAGAAIAPAQSWQRGDRDDRYRRDDGYRRNSRQYFQSPVYTTLRDLEQIGAGNSYYNGRERSRFDNA